MVHLVLEGLRGLKGDTGPKGDKGDKGDFEFDGKTTMAADLNMAAKKIIHLATPSDAVNKSNKLNKKVINKKTLHKYYHKKLRLFNRAKRGSRH